MPVPVPVRLGAPLLSDNMSYGLLGIAPVFIKIHYNSLDVVLFIITNPKVTVFATHSLTDIVGITTWFR